MSDKLQSLEIERVEKYKEYKQKTMYGIFGFVAAGLILLVALGFDFPVLAIIVVVIAAVVGVVFIGMASKIAVDYSKKAKSKLVRLLLEEMYTNVKYDMNSYIPTGIVTGSGLVSRPDRAKGNDLIVADYKGVNVTVSDLHYERRETRVDSKGNTYTTYVTMFKGRFYIFKFNRKFEHQLKIVERGLFNLNSFGRNFKKYDTESINFNKKFNIYSTDQQFMFYIVTPIMLEKFQELEQMHRGHIGFSISGDQLMIAVNDSHDYLEVKLRNPINEQTVKTLRSDTDIMASIINEFRLHTSKFNNNDNK